MFIRKERKKKVNGERDRKTIGKLQKQPTIRRNNVKSEAAFDKFFCCHFFTFFGVLGRSGSPAYMLMK